MARVRLFVEHPLGAGQPVPLSREAAHYLFGVMRLAEGATLAVFNGEDGEWAARVVEAGKKGGTLEAVERTAPQWAPPDLWLLFAPVKKARTDFIVEKAVEMGVRRLVPVATEHTNSERIRRDRLQAHAREAAEQCGAVFVPEVADLARLADTLAAWPEARRIMFCDEGAAGAAGIPERAPDEPGPWAILIGPEGGFSEAERSRLRAMPQAWVTALGPRILRADTAAVAALTLWQSRLGDWR
ncbi:Ribosomal RNA small subunit methyltransferase E [Roseivivax jejudonensis]|uniref:Ribosomal RNA small subunit methyltransferase E n=1 Tax=Roseivivax jejudonensis TaxID=1529041 RepID=A0A1X6ZTE2_9RHOB|nr:16S rRNA (uracil(1498)-N(3))-methyltransferase [Roseivivax jejudonensis]SLN59102.1 Ribosomal RNA small subunit methyltransferase E [Roseivivax jejudonensis]